MPPRRTWLTPTTALCKLGIEARVCSQRINITVIMATRGLLIIAPPRMQCSSDWCGHLTEKLYDCVLQPDSICDVLGKKHHRPNRVEESGTLPVLSTGAAYRE